MKRFYRGLVPDPPDYRDLPLSNVLPPAPPRPLPNFWMLVVQSIRDQSSLGSCVGMASACMKEWQEYNERFPYATPTLSPLYIYQECKKIDGLDGGGTYIRVAMKVLQKQGVCTETCCPYQPHIGQNYCEDAEEEAKKYRIRSYAKLEPTVEAAKRAIFEAGPAVIGVYTSYQWGRSKDGVIKNMTKSKRTGGHAIALVGWSDQRQAFIFANSWGEDWGKMGFGDLPYEYFQDHFISGWTSVDMVEKRK